MANPLFNMDAREILGMDSNGVMPIGIGALQKILNTLKEYKKEIERLTFLLNDRAEECQHWLEKITQLDTHIANLNQQIVDLEGQTVTLRCVNSIDITQL